MKVRALYVNSKFFYPTERDGTSARTRSVTCAHCICKSRALPQDARVCARARDRLAHCRLRFRASQNSLLPPRRKVHPIYILYKHFLSYTLIFNLCLIKVNYNVAPDSGAIVHRCTNTVVYHRWWYHRVPLFHTGTHTFSVYSVLLHNSFTYCCLHSVRVPNATCSLCLILVYSYLSTIHSLHGTYNNNIY